MSESADIAGLQRVLQRVELTEDDARLSAVLQKLLPKLVEMLGGAAPVRNTRGHSPLEMAGEEVRNVFWWDAAEAGDTARLQEVYKLYEPNLPGDTSSMEWTGSGKSRPVEARPPAARHVATRSRSHAGHRCRHRPCLPRSTPAHDRVDAAHCVLRVHGCHGCHGY